MERRPRKHPNTTNIIFRSIITRGKSADTQSRCTQCGTQQPANIESDKATAKGRNKKGFASPTVPADMLRMCGKGAVAAPTIPPALRAPNQNEMK